MTFPGHYVHNISDSVILIQAFFDPPKVQVEKSLPSTVLKNYKMITNDFSLISLKCLKILRSGLQSSIFPTEN